MLLLFRKSENVLVSQHYFVKYCTESKSEYSHSLSLFLNTCKMLFTCYLSLADVCVKPFLPLSEFYLVVMRIFKEEKEDVQQKLGITRS